MYRITIVEDDDKIAEQLAGALERYGFQPQRAARFKDLNEDFREHEPHLVLMDINLPYFDGFYWCRQFRQHSKAPVLFISARSGEMDQVMAIENGGDDYVTKPIHLDLLMAKIKSALRRAYGEYSTAADAAASGDAEQAVAMGALGLDASRSLLEWQGGCVELTKNERLLAQSLMEGGGRIVSRDSLLENLWDDTSFVDDNTLTVNVTRLRRKLEEIGLGGVLETVRGQGYRLNEAALREAGAGRPSAAGERRE
ncbi:MULTISPECIES: response regulator transcription factor [unclassified Paenibacillus]|uniref:response regulator transcription factor n=1 Tax=unclassified Paenibacillus TaxID=185978 RepID=UPI0009549E7A|nr:MULTISPECIES: response regulator transcription factor [unclassified Paenibacillus]ASS66675.1 response regulator transcription factor [Paenibacillus sp. RUD330]SIP98971.1 DNA-binding response regulator, OmpR family, contains REC and winged-helix (wHTH) domain [Paenibacillus sp. RU4X]SIQ17905.1 DNA-binding response regulator, OmpR family, contains REC and winged-helix (wHTH) domain [Paenibacillus sp. RU4T]